MVVELAGIEGSGLALDQLARQFDLLRGRRFLADVLEIGVGLAHLVLIAQGQKHHAAAIRLDGAQPFAPGNRQLTEAGLFGLAQGVADNSKGLFVTALLRRDEIGAVEIDVVDIVKTDELGDIEGLRGRNFQVLDLIGFEQDVFALFNLITLDDLVAFDLVTAFGDIHMAHALARLAVDFVQGQGARTVERRIDAHLQGHQRHAQIAAPVGSQGHRASLKRQRAVRLNRPRWRLHLLVESVDVIAMGDQCRQGLAGKGLQRLVFAVLGVIVEQTDSVIVSIDLGVDIGGIEIIAFLG